MMLGLPSPASFIDGEELFVAAVIAVAVLFATSVRRTPSRCPRCREVNRDHAQFCAQCGTRLSKR
jgi:rRNA maturation endonuclease Nob1